MIQFIRRRRFKFPSKSHSFALVHQLASPINCPRGTNPEKLAFKPSINQEQLKLGAKATFLSPQTVLTTLQNCPSDLVALSFFLWCARQPNYFHDKPGFHHMVGVVSKLTQRCGTVRDIIEELESIGCFTKAQTFLLLMRIYWRGAMYDMVLEAFEVMCGYGYVPNTYVRNIIVDVLFKIGRVDAALSFLKGTPAPNFLSFNISICNLCKLNEVDKVKSVFRCMLLRGYYMNPETYGLVLNCFCKFGRLEEASQLLGMMVVLGVPVSVNVWSILIDGYCKSGLIEVAAYILEKMVAVGCSPNIVTCTSLIKAFLESRMPEKAFKLLGTLESKGCFPDLVLCNVLIDCLSKIGRYESAFEVFSSLRDLSLKPDVYTYSSLVTAINLSRQYVLLPLVTSGLAVQPDLVVCNCLLNYFCQSGYPEGAIEFYDDMIERGFLPDKYSFAGVLSALCKLGRLRDAVNVYHGIVHSYPAGIDAHIHTIVINALAKSGSFHQAIRIFAKASANKFPLDAVSYNVAIDVLIRDGRVKEAYSIFGQMKEMEIVPNQRTYNMILSGFCKDRDIHVVKYILKEMIDANITMDYHAFRLMKKLLCDFPDSVLAYLVSEMRILGLLPKEDEIVLVNEHDIGAYASFSSSNNYVNVMDFGRSSSDEEFDAIVSVC
ncbi:putative pentatricopeptide repeat-containing protein At1g16830 [Salvia miltiorrhiza]|uniref:putative pentatricopeptide repeat-containing protein At1g16830 n=1 Tax=Salvia miltiorrhiza TaxID=226208 RepID=UPI0025ACCCD6|nr:putative pentatricopeptide repeat-containing protein At1g16830 [Salvia miltiorrhiza]XP_057784467.1 putative pentatricopeptide repeat-containing protein At1g16830 [Salvia miltiorrhiza]